MMTRQNIALLAALCAGLMGSHPASAVNYGTIELGATGSYTIPSAINNLGQVVGSLNDWSGAFIWDPVAGKTDLVPAGDPFAAFNFVLPTAISDTGRVVGYAYTPFSTPPIIDQAFVTGPNGMGMAGLGTAMDKSVANGINAGGQIVGSVSTGTTLSAFVTDPNNGHAMTLINNSLGGSGSQANGINTAGQVVGWAGTVSGDSHAFVTDPNNNHAMTDLGTLGGLNSNAYAINDAGVVVGDASVSAAGFSHAFLYDPLVGSMVNLGNLMNRGPTYNSSALAINSFAQVVGWSDIRVPGATVKHAFLMNAGEINMTSLNDLNTLIDLASLGGDFLSVAYGINDSGQIIASSWWGGAYLLSPITDPAPAAARFSMTMLAAAPVPEPETYALLLLGLGLVGWFARRRGVYRPA